MTMCDGSHCDWRNGKLGAFLHVVSVFFLGLGGGSQKDAMLTTVLTMARSTMGRATWRHVAAEAMEPHAPAQRAPGAEADRPAAQGSSDRRGV